MTPRRRHRPPTPPVPSPDLTRRAPAQDRGLKRVEELLDAGEAVIAEAGVEGATTNAIAERAGAGMGSLYHFFPNKEAIVIALAERYAAELQGIFAAMRRPEMVTIPVPEMVDRIVDPLVSFHRRHPAYRHVYHATNRPGQPSSKEAELHGGIETWVEELIAARCPATAPTTRRIQAVVSVEMVHRMLDFTAGVTGSARRAVEQEIKRLLALYCRMMESGEDPYAGTPRR